jgi:hypothetical protein
MTWGSSENTASVIGALSGSSNLREAVARKLGLVKNGAGGADALDQFHRWRGVGAYA